MTISYFEDYEVVEVVKKGRSKVGAYYLLGPDRILTYLAFRTNSTIFRDGPGLLSDSMRADKAMWGFEESTIFACDRKGAKQIGVLNRTENTLHITTLDKFLTPGEYHKARGSWANQRFLPLTAFEEVRFPVTFARTKKMPLRA